MTILSVVKDVCLSIGLEQPSALFSNTDREYQELASLSNEMARRIMQSYDWQALKIIATFMGDGTVDSFDMPTDYDRMVEGNAIWSSRWVWSLGHVSDVNTWLDMVVTNFVPVNGNWIVYGEQFHFLPAMSDGETVKFFYVSKRYARDKDGIIKDAFSADDDTFRLSEYLLKLAIIWRWRAMKSLPYEEDLQDYEIELARLMRKDSGSQGVVSGNRLAASRDVKLAWPGRISGVSG